MGLNAGLRGYLETEPQTEFHPAIRGLSGALPRRGQRERFVEARRKQIAFGQALIQGIENIPHIQACGQRIFLAGCIPAAEEPTAASAVVVDMVRANKLGLVAIDGSMAMEGNGPSLGKTFKMDVIVAGTNPVAADMVAASVMGFAPAEVPTFLWANKAGLRPGALEEIEIRGEPIQRARHAIRPYWGNQEIARNLYGGAAETAGPGGPAQTWRSAPQTTGA